MKYTEAEYNELSKLVIKCAIEVHKELGPGLLEAVYEVCLLKALKNEGLDVRAQVLLPVYYKGEKLDKNFYIDILVNNVLILEVKSVEAILPIHEAQLVTYLKLANKKLGLLINFNEELLKDGLRRKINGDLNEIISESNLRAPL